MTLRYLIACACGFSLGMAVFAIFQAEGFRLGTLGIWTMLWLSQMVVSTGSLIWFLCCGTNIERKPRET